MNMLKVGKTRVIAILSACMLASAMPAYTPYTPLPAAGRAAAAGAEQTRVIPYPEGLDTKSEGASSAPGEINHPASPYFSENDYFTMKNTGSRTILSHYPTYQQATEYTCGPAAALTVLYYYGNRDFDEMSLAKGMKTQGYPIGTNPFDMVEFFRTLGWEVRSSLDSPAFDTYSAFMDFAQSNLRRGVPIMVENVEWGGHWRVIIGYDSMGTESTLDDVLIMADPYDTCDHMQDGYVVQNGEKFYSMWFDHYMLPEKQRNQPWITAEPKK